MHTRTIVIAVTLDFGLDADTAFAVRSDDLADQLKQCLELRGFDQAIRDFRHGLQCDIATVTFACEEE